MWFSTEFTLMLIHQRNGSVKCKWQQIYRKELSSCILETLMACWPQGYLENHSQLRWMFQGVFGCQHILGFITVSWFYLLFILFYKIFGWGGMWYDWKKNFNLVSHFSYWIFFMLLEIIINRVKYHSLWHLFNHEIE